MAAPTGFNRPVQTTPQLAAIVGGATPLARTEITKRVWAYIKAHGLQDTTHRRMINADELLLPIFDGQAQVSMFEMTKLVNKHILK